MSEIITIDVVYFCYSNIRRRFFTIVLSLSIIMIIIQSIPHVIFKKKNLDTRMDRQMDRQKIIIVNFLNKKRTVTFLLFRFSHKNMIN